MSKPIRVLLVDDHPVVRTGYRHLLESDADIEVIAEAGDSATAYEKFKTVAPDVIVMDISLPGVSGIETMKRMRSHRPGARVLIFSMHDAAIFHSRALGAGAAGFLSKSSAPEHLVEAVRMIARGGSFGGDVAPKAPSQQEAPEAEFQQLSSREVEVLRLWSQELSLPEIGQKLGVSDKTVANVLSLIRQKLSVKSDLQLIRIVQRLWSRDGSSD